MSRGRLGVVLAGLLLLAALVLLGPVVLLAVDEGAVPSSSDVPPLPAGVTVAQEDVQCGSGGCWRELRLNGPPGRSPAEVAASIGLPHEQCRARGLFDRRHVCSGIRVVGNDVRLYVRFDRSFSL